MIVDQYKTIQLKKTFECAEHVNWQMLSKSTVTSANIVALFFKRQDKKHAMSETALRNLKGIYDEFN